LVPVIQHFCFFLPLPLPLLLLLPYPLQHHIFELRTTAWQMGSEVGDKSNATVPFSLSYVPDNIYHAMKFFFARATDQRAALEDSLRYAQDRTSFGKPIWQHQSIGNYLADMATSYTAARQLVRHAAELFDRGERCDMEAGMAKLFASEAAMQIALNAVRIHGGYGYSTEFDVERYFRDAPLMIVGEGTNEIQRNVIVAQLVSRGLSL